MLIINECVYSFNNQFNSLGIIIAKVVKLFTNFVINYEKYIFSSINVIWFGWFFSERE